MAIKIKTPNDLERLLDRLSRDIMDSIHYLKLFQYISTEIDLYPNVFAQSNTFWWLTTKSLSDSSMHALGRVYDTQESALSLPNLLTIISQNRHFFSVDHFRERLKDNPFVESLSECARIPDFDQLAVDIDFCSISNPLVHKLIIWRNHLYAHIGAKSTLSDTNILSENPITWEEVAQLSNDAFRIYNHYLSLFKAASWSSMMMGLDDFKSLLKFAQSGLDFQTRHFDIEMAKYDDSLPLGLA